MRVEEAEWIGRHLAHLEGISPAVELGSSTFHFRTHKKPHIDRLIHAPLRARGIHVVHADYKQDDGVDIAGDIFDPNVQKRLRDVQPRLLICCNMFEHVTDRGSLADLCSNVVPAGGYLVLTCPHSYPLHMDPIDTYFRPTPAEMAAMFPGFDVVSSDIVRSSTYAKELVGKKSKLPRLLLRHIYRLLMVWTPPSRYRERNHRLLWLFRPYKITCVVLRKRDAEQTGAS